MAQSQPISLADLLADAENPRLSEPREGQRDILRALAELQGNKFTRLAGDIVEYGLNPGDPFFVIPAENGSLRFIVVEGNRRLAALRALENPDTFEGAVQPRTLTTLRRLAKSYQEAPIEMVNCTLFNNREETRHWVHLRHAGESEGAGIVRWPSDAASRFAAGTGEGPTETQALNFLEKRADITSLERSRVPATTLRRLLDTPRVRERIGLGYKDRKLQMLAGEDDVAKALLWIVQGLLTGEITEPKITSIQDRIDFANNLPEDIVVATKEGEGVDLSEAERRTPKRRKRIPKPKPRTILIPSDCDINVTDERISRIESELRRLDIEDFSNSVGVMLRVFIELSGDNYITRQNLKGIREKDSLAKKLTAVTKDLQARSKLSDKQATPVLKACQAGSLLAPSISLMHEYVHNPYLFPSTSDLRNAWDNLEPFIKALWEV